MTLRVVGAGVGRTGTHSLKLALEHLLGGRCYHMFEVVGRPGDMTTWRDAALGSPPDWHELYRDFVATVDWPAAGFYRQISEAFPEAVVVLSTRDSAEAWWTSASRTIFDALRWERDGSPNPFDEMWTAVAGATFTPDFAEEQPAKDAYERHNEEVRAAIEPGRLVEWRPGDGWVPLCDALGVPVPPEPFPHVNTTEDFRTLMGLDPA